MTAKEVAARFKKVGMTNGRYMAECPCHPDKHRSLMIEERGRLVRLTCMAGCLTSDVLEAVGLNYSDLINNPEDRDGTESQPVQGESAEETAEAGDTVTLARPGNPAGVPVFKASGELAESVQQLGQYIGQLGAIIGAMQRRMDEMEKQQAAVTIRHEDVKRLQALIRMRAEQICGKYELKDKDSPRIFRAAIKKDVLKRSGVKDLHDVPAAQLAGIENLVNGWTNIRLTMERRAKA